MQKEAKKLNRKEKNENEDGMSQWKISGQLSYIYMYWFKNCKFKFLTEKEIEKTIKFTFLLSLYSKSILLSLNQSFYHWTLEIVCFILKL